MLGMSGSKARARGALSAPEFKRIPRRVWPFRSVVRDYHSVVPSILDLRVAQPEPYCSVSDPELFSNLPKAGSPRPQAMRFFVIDNAAGTSKLFAARSCVADTSANALTNQVAL